MIASADLHWLHPRLGPFAGVIAAILLGEAVFVAPWRARRGYRRLDGSEAMLLRRYRQAVVMQALRIVLVLVAVVGDGRLTRPGIGITTPHGPHVDGAYEFAAYLVVLTAASGALMRRRALAGRSVPGQATFEKLIPGSGRARAEAAAVAIGAGLSEELLFRGLFLAALMVWFGMSTGWAAVVATVVFALVHLYQGWKGVLGVFLIGALLTGLYLASRSLVLPIIVHVVIDLRGLVLVPRSRHVPTARPRRRVRVRARRG